MLRPTKKEQAKWEQILKNEDLDMDRGRNCGSGYLTYEADMTLPAGAEHISPLEFYAKRQFDYTLRTASPFHGMGRAAGFLSKRGKEGTAKARAAMWKDPTMRAYKLKAMHDGRDKLAADPVRLAARGRAVSEAKARQSPEEKQLARCRSAITKLRKSKERFQLWPPVEVCLGQLFPPISRTIGNRLTSGYMCC
jgi:hypothetical protein